MTVAHLVPADAPALPPLAFEWASTIGEDLSDLEEIVEGVITAGGMSVWYGEPNSGKTTMLLDLALRMPSGLPWLGRRVLKGGVIYVALEGAGSIKRRLMAYRKRHDCKVHAFGVVSSSLNLMSPSADVEELLTLVQEKQAEMLSSSPIRLIVVDTVARAMGGADENASQDMARFIAAGDLIRKETGAHIAFVHHSGKDASKGARGHSSLRGAVDTEVEITETGKVHTAEIVKQRDLDTKGLKLSARFLSVQLGVNQWDNPVTACVVEPIEEPTEHMAALMRQTDHAHADRVVIRGFKELKGMGIDPTEGKGSPNSLVKQMLEKGLAEGFDRADLISALGRLMVRGTFRCEVIGRYGSNRAERKGLVLYEAQS